MGRCALCVREALQPLHHITSHALLHAISPTTQHQRLVVVHKCVGKG
jgi:hypothetical protein